MNYCKSKRFEMIVGMIFRMTSHLKIFNIISM